MSIGQEEDRRAFEAMVRRFYEVGPPKPPKQTWATWPTITDGLHFAFAAGMVRGEEKRGCCEERNG